ncbi:MAG: cystathionine beta-synthase [Oligoflexia bacterium]|nr:MAG: cystathionine beta-synthase [Oligoflexia bacterium]
MKSVYSNIIESIGHTPIIKLNKIPHNSKHTFWVKMEYFNPGGSVKDRVAAAIIEEAEKRGDLKPGGTIIEATSGNTGLGLAMISAVKGYKTIFVMPDKISEEKRAILRAYGAKVVITPTAVEPEDPRSYLSVAKKLVEITPNSFYANQYHNPDNPERHYKTTGPEIWEQMGDKLNVFVAGAGTGGTISGVGKYLKEKNKNIQVILADPMGSILYDLYYHKKVITPPHPYKVEGVGEDMLPDNVHFNVMDGAVQVDDKSAFLMTRELVAKEGICVGPSSAMALCAAIEWSKKLEKPSNILVLFPDNGRGYLSKAFNDSWMRENGFLPSPLKSKTVGDLIESREGHDELITADVGESVIQVVTKLKKAGISQVPVYSNGQIVGILDETDILEPLVRGSLKPTEPIIHLVKGSIVYVNKTDDLAALNDHLLKGYVALVKDGTKLHIISKIDLLQFMGDMSELN